MNAAGQMRRQPSLQSSTLFMKYDFLMLSPFRHFFGIYPMLVATGLEMSEHFLPEGCRSVIEQRGSHAEYVMIITFSHFKP
jgi:hypothetical protein